MLTRRARGPQIYELIAIFDHDCDGVLSLDEFRGMVSIL